METYESLKNWVSGALQSASSPFQSVAPSVTTTQGSTSLFGTAPETPGYTSTGGRKYTRSSKKSKKTRKSKRRN
jgi:hypothetical protein